MNLGSHRFALVRAGLRASYLHEGFCPGCTGDPDDDSHRGECVIGLAVETLTQIEDEAGRLREELMRVGALAISERQDGCVNKTTALRIREIAYRTCWPE